MLVVGAVMLLAVLVYAIGEPGAERNHVGFQSVYLVLAAGVSASFLTGDLFNLFVAFEMMLTASYVLLTLGGRREQVRSGMTYVVISLLASTLFVTAARPAVRGDGHGQHGRSRRAGSASCRRACAAHFAVLLLVGVRHQGRAVPAVLLAAGQLPDRAVADHRGLRRPADEGRRLRHHPHPDPVLLRRQPTGDAAPRARRRHDGRRRARRDRPGRREAHPLVHDRQPDRLHGRWGSGSSPSPAWPRSCSRSSTTSWSRRRCSSPAASIEHAGGSSRLRRLGGMVTHRAAAGRACSCCSALEPGRHPAALGVRRQARADRRRHRRRASTRSSR